MEYNTTSTAVIFTIIVAKESSQKIFLLQQIANDDVCKHYFHMLELKQSTVDKDINLWQLRLTVCNVHYSEQ